MSGHCLPTLYAAATLEAAAWESLFHDVPHEAGPKSVRLNKVTTKVLSVIELTRDVVVAPLHGPDLNRIGLAKTDLIETPPAAYAETARWAEAFHRGDPAVAGLRWTSRRCDPELAFVFFEDRLPQAAWTVVELEIPHAVEDDIDREGAGGLEGVGELEAAVGGLHDEPLDAGPLGHEVAESHGRKHRLHDGDARRVRNWRRHRGSG